MTIEALKLLTPEQYAEKIEDVLQQWYVADCITGELISIADLRYWDVTTQQAYASPLNIPANQSPMSSARVDAS